MVTYVTTMSSPEFIANAGTRRSLSESTGKLSHVCVQREIPHATIIYSSTSPFRMFSHRLSFVGSLHMFDSWTMQTASVLQNWFLLLRNPPKKIHMCKILIKYFQLFPIIIIWLYIPVFFFSGFTMCAKPRGRRQVAQAPCPPCGPVAGTWIWLLCAVISGDKVTYWSLLCV